MSVTHSGYHRCIIASSPSLSFKSAGFFQPIQRIQRYIDIIDIDERSLEGSDTKIESRTAAVQRDQDGKP